MWLGYCAHHLERGERLAAAAIVGGYGLCADCAVEQVRREREAGARSREESAAIRERVRRRREWQQEQAFPNA